MVTKTEKLREKLLEHAVKQPNANDGDIGRLINELESLTEAELLERLAAYGISVTEAPSFSATPANYVASRATVRNFTDINGRPIGRAITTAGDGACAFRAVAHAVHPDGLKSIEQENQFNYELRQKACDMLPRLIAERGINIDEFNQHLSIQGQPTFNDFNSYIANMRKNSTDIDLFTLDALCLYLDKEIVVITDNGVTHMNAVFQNSDGSTANKDKIVIHYNGCNHYSAIELNDGINAEQFTEMHKAKLAAERAKKAAEKSAAHQQKKPRGVNERPATPLQTIIPSPSTPSSAADDDWQLQVENEKRKAQAAAQQSEPKRKPVVTSMPGVQKTAADPKADQDQAKAFTDKLTSVAEIRSKSGDVIAEVVKTKGKGECVQNAVIYGQPEVTDDESALKAAMALRDRMISHFDTEFNKLSTSEKSLVLSHKTDPSTGQPVVSGARYKELMKQQTTWSHNFDMRLMSKALGRPVWVMRIGAAGTKAELVEYGQEQKGEPLAIFFDGAGHASHIRFKPNCNLTNILSQPNDWTFQSKETFEAKNYLKLPLSDSGRRNGVVLHRNSHPEMDTLVHCFLHRARWESKLRPAKPKQPVITSLPGPQGHNDIKNELEGKSILVKQQRIITSIPGPQVPHSIINEHDHRDVERIKTWQENITLFRTRQPLDSHPHRGNNPVCTNSTIAAAPARQPLDSPPHRGNSPVCTNSTIAAAPARQPLDSRQQRGNSPVCASRTIAAAPARHTSVMPSVSEDELRRRKELEAKTRARIKRASRHW